MEMIDESKDLVLVNYRCEKCEMGVMLYHHHTEVVEGKLLYLNRCKSCGHEVFMQTFYPTVKERHRVGDLSQPGLLLHLCSKECEQ